MKAIERQIEQLQCSGYAEAQAIASTVRALLDVVRAAEPFMMGDKDGEHLACALNKLHEVCGDE